MKRSEHLLSVVLLLCTMLATGVEEAVAEDPALRGPYEVTVAEYDFGDSAFHPSDFPIDVEVRASVHYPSQLDDGPFPLVVFLHGRHSTCYDTNFAYLQWPCGPTRKPIPSYRGYDYIAEILASHGFVVVSISANGINAYDNSVADRGALARAELIQYHLGLWKDYSTSGATPFGGLFVGALDLQNVGTMGHSRGGEGVVRHFLLNRALGSPYGIRAVFPLAPVDFSRWVINRVPLAVLLPYCDGDLSDLQGVHFYDDARYNLPGDEARKHTILVMGANHNFYNTVWTPSIFPQGSADDWLAWQDPDDPHCGDVAGNARLTDAEQRGTGLAYITAFFRTYLGEGTEFLPMLTGTAPPPPSAMTDELFVSFHSPDDPRLRLDVNRLLVDTNLTTNTLGGAASQVDLSVYGLCGDDYETRHCLPDESDDRQPHTSVSYLASSKLGLSQLRLQWDSGFAAYVNELPAEKRDVSGYSLLQFRVGVNFADPRNPVGSPQDFSVVLSDGGGHAGVVRVSDYSDALFYPPGELESVPKVVLNTVPVPLGAFAGVDLSDVTSVRFDFDQESSGALLLTDVAFSNVGVSAGASADLAVSMTDQPDPVRVGKELSYRVTLVNDGPSEASNVILTDTLPPEVAFKSASSGCSYGAGTVICGPLALPPGAAVAYEMDVIVEQRPSDGKLENTAVVAADVYDPNLGTNTATVVTRVAGGGSGRE